jgi:hypothetical protein
MTWLARLVCPHRVVTHDRGSVVCSICGATLRPARS